MLPTDSSPQSRLEYISRLLAALCLQSGGELRIPSLAMQQLEQEPARQALFYDENLNTGEIVIRFGTRNSAVFPVEPCKKTQPSQVVIDPSRRPQPPAFPSQESDQPRVRKPMSDAELARAERKIKALRTVLQMRREQQEPQPEILSEP